jgi:hypothetical protein
MSNRPFDETYIWKLAEGERYSRPGEFVYGRGRWWLGDHSPESEGPQAHPWPPANGREFIEVIEIVASGTLGKIAIYRQWIIDPDGGDCTAPWAPRRSKMLLRRESTLRSTLNGGDYYRESGSKPTPTKPKAKPKLRVVASHARVH